MNRRVAPVLDQHLRGADGLTRNRKNGEPMAAGEQAERDLCRWVQGSCTGVRIVSQPRQAGGGEER